MLNAIATVRGGSPGEAGWAVACFVAMLIGIFVWAGVDAVRKARRAREQGEEPMPLQDASELDWESLEETARKVIEQTIERLPPPLKKEAEELGWSWAKWSQDFSSRTLLGEFTGPNRMAPAGSGGSAIYLYLGDLHEFCAQYGKSFEDEVRITYLHELGHYLGFNEDDLEERGLQ